MDVVSYLLGKNAGGGGGNLQEKSVTVTANGSSTISPDEGYTGISKVNLTTNVVPPSAPTKGVVFSEWDNDGFAGKAQIVGFTSIPNYYFSDNAGASFSSKITEVLLPNDLTSIGTYAFNQCHVGQINLPNSVTSVGIHAFDNCSQLTNISWTSQVNSIPGSCFFNCTNLKTIDASNVTQVGDNAFMNCSSLESFNVANLTGIGNNSFNACLKMVFDRINIDALGTSSFSRCNAVKKVSMPNMKRPYGTSSTGGAFYGCSGLKQVWFGSQLTSIYTGRYLFKGCTALEKIYIDLPRATVEAFTNYQYAFMDDTTKTGIIVCNDDPGFINLATFDAQVIN